MLEKIWRRFVQISIKIFLDKIRIFRESSRESNDSFIILTVLKQFIYFDVFPSVK